MLFTKLSSGGMRRYNSTAAGFELEDYSNVSSRFQEMLEPHHLLMGKAT